MKIPTLDSYINEVKLNEKIGELNHFFGNRLKRNKVPLFITHDPEYEKKPYTQDTLMVVSTDKNHWENPKEWTIHGRGLTQPEAYQLWLDVKKQGNYFAVGYYETPLSESKLNEDDTELINAVSAALFSQRPENLKMLFDVLETDGEVKVPLSSKQKDKIKKLLLKHDDTFEFIDELHDIL